MEVTEHIETLRSEGQLLAAAAASAGVEAPVPSCPQWVVRDLVRHQGGVHRWACGIVSGPRTEAWDADLDEIVGSWPSDADLIGWFTEGHAALVGALSRAPRDLECWTFLAAPTPLAMWARRQAHETTVHRVDAELAAGRVPSVISPQFAADGIDELLTCFITRPGGRLRSDATRRLTVSCTDAPAGWQVVIGRDRVSTTPLARVPAPAPADTRRGDQDPFDHDCAVSGTATDLYLTLWNRRPPDGLSVDGDRRTLDLFGDKVRVRWS